MFNASVVIPSECQITVAVTVKHTTHMHTYMLDIWPEDVFALAFQSM